MGGIQSIIPVSLCGLWVALQKYWVSPQIIPFLIGFSIMFTIHFGGFTPIFGVPPIYIDVPKKDQNDFLSWSFFGF